MEKKKRNIEIKHTVKSIKNENDGIKNQTEWQYIEQKR